MGPIFFSLLSFTHRAAHYRSFSVCQKVFRYAPYIFAIQSLRRLARPSHSPGWQQSLLSRIAALSEQVLKSKHSRSGYGSCFTIFCGGLVHTCAYTQDVRLRFTTVSMLKANVKKLIPLSFFFESKTYSQVVGPEL